MAIFSMKEFTMMAITTADVFDPAHGDDEVWRNWNPTLDNDHLTLGEVYESLPGFPPEAIHPLVCLFENPESRLAFPGVASLRRHDCLHILLGRGLLGQDEAFVIGFTMGTSHISSPQVWAFKKIAQHLYPDIYRMSARDLVAYDLGFGYGSRHGRRDIAEFPFGQNFARSLGELRCELGFNKRNLRATYRLEQILLPDSAASRRLPVERGMPRLAV